jgi:Uma2 family endonuclease
VQNAIVDTMDLDSSDIRPTGLRRITRSEYDQMVELGMFEGEHLELLRGLLVPMSPEGWRHSDVAAWLTERFILAFAGAYSVRCGHPFATEDSEPQPDVFVGPKLVAARAHPNHALLLIEVANTSLRRDRRVKRSIYAEAGVPEYWIIDISDDEELRVEVYTDPRDGDYSKLVTLREGEILRPLHVPIEIAISDLPR